mmetsp:Transcript_58533/g.163107  ORF Transcript_58533/g.163107 Transcript_58533/m.163107 type:complete len:223 (+) Transcript_58533:1637-2305(+)
MPSSRLRRLSCRMLRWRRSARCRDPRARRACCCAGCRRASGRRLRKPSCCRRLASWAPRPSPTAASAARGSCAAASRTSPTSLAGTGTAAVARPSTPPGGTTGRRSSWPTTAPRSASARTGPPQFGSPTSGRCTRRAPPRTWSFSSACPWHSSTSTLGNGWSPLRWCRQPALPRRPRSWTSGAARATSPRAILRPSWPTSGCTRWRRTSRRGCSCRRATFWS